MTTTSLSTAIRATTKATMEKGNKTRNGNLSKALSNKTNIYRKVKEKKIKVNSNSKENIE